MPADLSRHARTLIEQYRLDDGIFQLRVRSGSPYVGALGRRDRPERVSRYDPRRHSGGGWQRPAEGPRHLRRRHPHRARGGGSRGQSRRRHGPRLPVGRRAGDVMDTLFNRASGLAEVVIPPRSGLVGQKVVPGDGHSQRRSHHPGRAAPGRGPGPGRNGAGRGRHALCSREPGRRSTSTSATPTSSSSTRRSWSAGRPFPWVAGAKQAIAVLLAMVLLLATGVVPPVVVGLLAAMRHRSCWDCSRSSRPIGPSTGPRSSWSAP